MDSLTERGKWMIREYISGDVIEKSKFWVPEQTKKRAPKAASSSHRKQDENDRDAVKTLARLINCNFQHADLWITLGYTAQGMAALCAKYAITDPGDIDAIKAAADHELVLFLRRMKREAEKAGISFRYIGMTSDTDGDSGEIERVHHHIIMPRAAYELCVRQWRYGGVDYQLLRDQGDYTPFAVYLCRQCRRQANEKRWHPSRNLKKPIVRETETHIKGELHIPHGAKVLDIGHYDIESGNHYVRYIRKPRDETPEREAETADPTEKKPQSVSRKAGGRRNL